MEKTLYLANGSTAAEYSDYGAKFAEPIADRSAKATLLSVSFKTETDLHNTLVSESVEYGLGDMPIHGRGQIFLLTFAGSDDARVYIVPSPDHVLPTVTIKNGTVEIDAGGYPVICSSCRKDGFQRLCRDWYRSQYKPNSIVAMSNTWGDRGGRDVVSEKFVLDEIDVGAEIGVDVVQVDDGWQKGAPNTYDEEGRRVFEGDFWDLKPNAFPDGIDYLPKYASDRGIKMGLWFAPHSRKCFEHFERDVSVLSQACNQWGYRYFKLDMLQLQDEEQCKKAMELLATIASFENSAEVELDVTADKRLGYLAPAAYGTLFVENRYTAYGNYYPHTTLRNLWKLSSYIPSSKFQFELVNPDRCTEKYSESDALRPVLYDIDYLFATVMVSNPLFWMEMQRLSENCIERLKNIVSVWRGLRDELTSADVSPIGEEPSGASMTGFTASSDNGIHAILFREVTDRDTYTFSLDENFDKAELVCSNTDVAFKAEGNSVTVKFGKKRSYVWLMAKR